MNKKNEFLFFLASILALLSYHSCFIGKIVWSNENPVKIPFWVFVLFSFLIISSILWNKFGEEGIRKRAKELNRFWILYSIILLPLFYYIMGWFFFSKFWRPFFSIFFAVAMGLWSIFFLKKKKLKKT